jgi:hypothetical protein
MGASIGVFSKCLGELPCRFRGQSEKHSAVINGPTPLAATDIEIPDIRAGMAHVLAAFRIFNFVVDILFRQNTNLFAFAFGSFASWTKPKILSFGKIRMGALCPRLSVSLQKIGCGSAISACKPARFLSPFPIFDIVLDRMRLGKQGTSSRFLSPFTIFDFAWIKSDSGCVCPGFFVF